MVGGLLAKYTARVCCTWASIFNVSLTGALGALGNEVIALIVVFICPNPDYVPMTLPE
jgi:hypothetical protein